MRNIIAAVLGTAVAFGIVSISDSIAGRLFQLPAGLDTNNPALMKSAMEAAIAQAPLSAVLTMVAGYFIAALVGAFIAKKIADEKSTRPPLMVGILVLAATILNFTMLHHPTLMVVLGVLAPMPGALLGARVASTK